MFCCCYSLSVKFDGDSGINYAYPEGVVADSYEIVPLSWVQSCPNLSRIDYLFSSYGNYPSTFMSWHVDSNCIISGEETYSLDAYLNYRKNNVDGYKVAENQLTLTSPPELFKNRNSLASINFVFYNAAYGGIGVQSNWQFDTRTFEITSLVSAKGAFGYT